LTTCCSFIPTVLGIQPYSVIWMLAKAFAENVSIFTARRGYASAVLEVVILSVHLSVRLTHACVVTNLKNLPAIFL